MWMSICPFKFLVLTAVCFSSLLLSTHRASAQQDKVSEIKKNSQDIANRIARTQALIKENAKSSKATLETWQLLGKSIGQRELYVENLSRQIDNLNQKIRELETDISDLQSSLGILEKEFGDLLLKTHRMDLMSPKGLFLLSANSVNDVFLRWRYFRQIGHSRKVMFQNFRDKKSKLELQKRELDAKKQELLALKRKSDIQLKELEAEKTQLDKTLAALRKDKKSLNAQLAKQKADKKVLDTKLKDMLRKMKATTRSTVDTKLSSDFARNKGRLPWPVEGGVVVRGFGEQPHPLERSVKIQSNGVDVSLGQQTQVKAIFKGEVLSASRLPGYGYAVFVQHGEYLSVYSKLDELTAQSGDKVAVGSVLGRMSAGSKNTFHFELWKGSKAVDPELWFVR